MGALSNSKPQPKYAGDVFNHSCNVTQFPSLRVTKLECKDNCVNATVCLNIRATRLPKIARMPEHQK